MKTKTLSNGKLHLEGVIGSVIDDCVDEVRTLAENVLKVNLCDEVTLQFNDKRLVIMYDGQLKSVSEIYAQYYCSGKIEGGQS